MSEYDRWKTDPDYADPETLLWRRELKCLRQYDGSCPPVPDPYETDVAPAPVVTEPLAPHDSPADDNGPESIPF